jgi:hypothetical protein
VSDYFCYRVFGLIICSEIELPELASVAAPVSGADVVIRRGSVPRSHHPATLDEEIANNNPQAALLIRNGREITVEPNPHADPAALRVWLLGRVMAYLFRQRGWLPLHASAVLIHNRCVLFLGASRAGKSTTAAVFHKLGHVVLTDDVAPVRIAADGRCFLQAAWSHVRLRPDVQDVLNPAAVSTGYQAGKLRYDLGGNGAGGGLHPVSCAYVIEFREEISVHPIETMQAIPMLSQFSFVRHRQMAKEALGIHLRDCADVAAAIPVRLLTRPRSLSALPSLARFVETDVAALSQRYK